MTNADILAQVLSEASGKPLALVREMMKALPFKLGPALDDEVPEERAQQLLFSLREELPAIRNWLLEGARRFVTPS